MAVDPAHEAVQRRLALDELTEHDRHLIALVLDHVQVALRTAELLREQGNGHIADRVLGDSWSGTVTAYRRLLAEVDVPAPRVIDAGG